MIGPPRGWIAGGRHRGKPARRPGGDRVVAACHDADAARRDPALYAPIRSEETVFGGVP
jgi:hypothetical protein